MTSAQIPPPPPTVTYLPDRQNGTKSSATIVLGVTGGIAAYKAVEVARRLIDKGIHVLPVMTDEAMQFIAPLTLSALCSEPVQSSLFDSTDPIPHTRLAQRANVIAIVPATANFIAKLSCGLADDLLSTTVLASKAPVIVCAAMHTEMWENEAVTHNVEILQSRGIHIIPPDEGRLAGGDSGVGRLAAVDTIVEHIESALHTLTGSGSARSGSARSDTTGSDRRDHSVKDLAGYKVLVTAGGTREPIDAVRVITNRSSGKQGYAVAMNAYSRGAEVTMVTTVDGVASPDIRRIFVETAAEMEREAINYSADADIIVMAAAVADFRPIIQSHTKLHRSDGIVQLQLEPTSDILAGLATRHTPGQIIVGFAAEIGMDEESAQNKLASKGIDIIVLNDITSAQAGFDSPNNEVVIMDSSGARVGVPLLSKDAVAGVIMDVALARLKGMDMPEVMTEP